MNSFGVFTPGPTYAIGATNSSVAVAIGSTNVGNTIWLYNSGSVVVYVALGASTIEAAVATTAWTMGSMPVPPGVLMAISRGDQTHIATITASGTTTLNVTVGEGF